MTKYWVVDEVFKMCIFRPSFVGAVLGWSRMSIRFRPARSTSSL